MLDQMNRRGSKRARDRQLEARVDSFEATVRGDVPSSRGRPRATLAGGAPLPRRLPAGRAGCERCKFTDLVRPQPRPADPRRLTSPFLDDLETNFAKAHAGVML